MRVIVTGATGNVGTSVLGALSGDPARGRGDRRGAPYAANAAVWHALHRCRHPRVRPRIDVRRRRCRHPSRLADPALPRPVEARATNVDGSLRVFADSGGRGVGARVRLVGRRLRRRTQGPAGRRELAADGYRDVVLLAPQGWVERELDRFEQESPELRVVRVRPGLIFKREAASEIRRFFPVPCCPGPCSGRARSDRSRRTGSALSGGPHRRCRRRLSARAAQRREGRVQRGDRTGDRLVGALGAIGRAPGVRAHRALRAGRPRLSFAAHLQPVEPGWLDLGVGVPTMDCSRVRRELGWTPARDARSVLRELAEGLRAGAAGATPPLSAAASGTARWREFATGLGSRP